MVKLQKTCLKCEYWTKNPKHGSYKCYRGDCPAKLRDGGKSTTSSSFHNRAWARAMSQIEVIEKKGYEVSIIDNECDIGTEGYRYINVAKGRGKTKLTAVQDAIVKFYEKHKK